MGISNTVMKTAGTADLKLYTDAHETLHTQFFLPNPWQEGRSNIPSYENLILVLHISQLYLLYLPQHKIRSPPHTHTEWDAL